MERINATSLLDVVFCFGESVLDLNRSYVHVCSQSEYISGR